MKGAILWQLIVLIRLLKWKNLLYKEEEEEEEEELSKILAMKHKSSKGGSKKIEIS